MTGDRSNYAWKQIPLLPCPFCGQAVVMEELDETRDRNYGWRRWWGIKCRSTVNRGGSCVLEMIPQASPEAVADRWNMRDGVLKAAP